MADQIIYRDATEADAGALAELFRESFCATFGHLYTPANLATFLAGHGPEQWVEQLRDEAIPVRIAESDGLVGLAKLGPLKLPVETEAPAMELRQIYVLHRMHGAGVGVQLMDWAIAEARRRGAAELYLSVYTDNFRAQRFYEKYGFVAVGPYVFMVGDHADEDIIMKLVLT
jgi:GNAT superfamily N-acetyltransferase